MLQKVKKTKQKKQKLIIDFRFLTEQLSPGCKSCACLTQPFVPDLLPMQTCCSLYFIHPS